MHRRIDGWDVALCVRAERYLPVAMVEFLAFGWKQAWACVFPLAMFAILALSHVMPLPLHRYDAILVGAVAVQWVMLRAGFEDRDDLRRIALFHVAGLGLELFKTQASIGSWAYPEPAWFKVAGVPLFSGFLYASVGSYVVNARRRLDLRFSRMPRTDLALLLGLAIYANFFTQHLIADVRWPLAAAVVVLFGRCSVQFRPWRRRLRLPMPVAFVLIGSFLWLAENLATLLRAYQYPNQDQGWRMVHLGKLSSWALLVVFGFVLAMAGRVRAVKWGDE